MEKFEENAKIVQEASIVSQITICFEMCKAFETI